MLIYTVILITLFILIFLPTYLVLSKETYSDFYFKDIEGRKILLNSREKDYVKINNNYIYKDYNNTFNLIKKYFRIVFSLTLLFLIYLILFYFNNKNYILENQKISKVIFLLLIVVLFFLINNVKVNFYYIDRENNKTLYRKILFGNFKKMNGNINYKYYNNKYKMIIKVKFKGGIPINIELKMGKNIVTKFTIYEIIDDNFNVEFITLINRKVTFLKGNGLMEFPEWLYGNYYNESKRFLQIKKNIFNISCKLGEDTNFFDIYFNNIFRGSTGIEDFFNASIIKGNVENYYKNGNLREKREYKNRDGYISESFYENGNLEYKYYPETQEEKYFYSTGELEKSIIYQDIKLFRVYYKNGKLKEKRETNKEGNGVFKTYYENGILQEIGNYKAWKKNGNFKKFYQNGKLKEIGKYEDEYIRGYIEKFFENGNLKEKGEIYEFDKEFCNSDPKFKKVGKFEYFYENGNIKEREVYNGWGWKDGVFEYFSKDGKLIKKENYKDGELI